MGINRCRTRGQARSAGSLGAAAVVACACACSGESTSTAGHETGQAGQTGESGGAAADGGAAGAPVGSGGAGGASSGSGGSLAAGGAGAAGAADTGGAANHPSLFDMPMIREQATAQCAFTNHRTAIKDGVTLDVWNVSYRSWESIGGGLQPILIRGFAAKPAGVASDLPGVVQAHGLGGFAKESNATGLAALLGAFVVAYTGPGGGDAPENTSEGRSSGYDNNYRMFDTLDDLRGTWFWGHSTAGMRGLTCLEGRSEVDASRLGMTGYSAGAVATLISASVDDRIIAAVPLSGALAWDVASESPNAWQHGLLQVAGLTTSSPEWTTLMELVRADALLPDTRGAVLMVNGSTDEFFPLTAHMATYDGIGGASKRTSFVGNLDHGCYALTGVEAASKIEARADVRARGGQRMWFGHWFGTNPVYAYLPAQPSATLTPVGAATFVTADVDEGGVSLDVGEVKIWWSNDDSLIYGSVSLDDQGNGVYSALAAFPTLANTITFVDVEYKTKDLIAPQRFSLSSRAAIPDGLVPDIRSMTSCVP